MSDNKTFFRKAEQKKLGLKDIFSDVFRRHTKEENARLFLAGTALTTPDEASMLAKWVKPYMFARIFIVGIALMAASILFGNELIVPFIFTLGSYLVPMTVMFFIWEMNVPRNISFAAVLCIFLVGGIESLVFTLLLYAFGSSSSMVIKVLLIGLFEEGGKLLAIMLWMRKGDKKYILSGMLVGAAVGAGFAAVESMGYAVIGKGSKMAWNMTTLVVRAFLAPGGHVAWAAIVGGCLAWAQGSEKMSGRHLANPKLLGGFAFSVLTHAAYDYFAFTGRMLGAVAMNLAVIAGTYMLLKIGLNQAVDAAMSRNSDRLTMALDHDFLDKLAAEPGGQAAGLYNCAGAQTRHHGAYQGAAVTTPAAPVYQASDLRIQGITGAFAGRRFAMQARIRLGRDPRRNDLVFPANTTGVSGVHCELLFSGSRMYVKDLESTYGTYVNGIRLNPNQPVEVQMGDHIYLGSAREELQITLRGGRTA